MNSRFVQIMSGVSARIFILVIGIGVMFLASLLVLETRREYEQLLLQRQQTAITRTMLSARNLEDQLRSASIAELTRLVTEIEAIPEVDDVVLEHSGRDLVLRGNTDHSRNSDNPYVEEQQEVQQLKNTVIRMTNGNLVVAEPLLQENSAVGSLVVRYRLPNIADTVWPILKAHGAIWSMIFIAGVFLALRLAKQICGPLSRLAVTIAKTSGEDSGDQIEIEGPMEVRQVATAFKSVVKRLKENIEQVYELAYVDRVTQLPNREFFRKELERAIHRSCRRDANGALLFVDLDGFKRVNDVHGHDIGDQLLLQFSERLGNVLRAEDLIGLKTVDNFDLEDEEEGEENKQMLARLGGDEFTVLLSEIRHERDAAIVAKRIIDSASEPFEFDGTKITIGASVGIGTFPRDGSDYQSILKSADMAMYKAKQEGKNTYRYYSEELNREASSRMQIESDLREALDANQFELYFQPKIDCETGRPRAVEALLRWNHPTKGMMQPLEFIPIAEDCGLILPIGRWVLEEACRHLVKFEELKLDLTVSVNISSPEFERADFSDEVMDVLKKTNADPRKLELEITESMAMQNPDRALSHFHVLKILGIRFAIDDFGTGYSNLSQLSRLPFDVFKIDRSFVEMLTSRDDEHGRTIVRTILGMAKSLNYETVAEGVETISQLEFLIEYGCNYAQGYYFARPMAARDLIDWCHGWKNKQDFEIAGMLRQGLVS